MMRKGVITVYLSVVWMVLMSLVMVLLESSRCYVIGTMTERYADMAAETVFSGYVRPLADRYDLLVLENGADRRNLEKFQAYLQLNLDAEGGSRRLFSLYAKLQSFQIGKTETIKDNNWQSMRNQIAQYEKYALGFHGIESLIEMTKQLQKNSINGTVKDYSGQLQSAGEKEKTDQTEGKAEKEEGDSENNIVDPRQGITRWLKSGILSLVMDGKAVSDQKIEIGNCSWHTEEASKQSMLSKFDEYTEVARILTQQDVLEQIRDGVHEKGTDLLVNAYIWEKFAHLCSEPHRQEQEVDSVLEYELEYILSGHETDRENLESCIAKIFSLRMLLNLVYLYTSQSKGNILQNIVQAMGLLPAAGQVVKLLVMVCWAAAEGVVDCAALADGKKIPLLKNDESWNLTMDQLMDLAKKGGHASAYAKDNSQGMRYEQYLMLFLLLMQTEVKLIRMSQLIECNIRMVDGYENFAFSNTSVYAEFSGAVQLAPVFWRHPSVLQHNFKVEYGY